MKPMLITARRVAGIYPVQTPTGAHVQIAADFSAADQRQLFTGLLESMPGPQLYALLCELAPDFVEEIRREGVAA